MSKYRLVTRPKIIDGKIEEEFSIQFSTEHGWLPCPSEIWHTWYATEQEAIDVVNTLKMRDTYEPRIIYL